MQIITFAAALGFAGLNLNSFVSKLIEVARTTARAITALKNVSGTAGKLADNLKFVNDMAGKYGLEINALISNYAKFAASAQISGMALKEQRAVFESVSRSVTAFGLSADEANGVFLALSQMMSKGKISSEELRLQMGERLPVALQAMAKAAGTTVAGLDKLLKQGKLMSADILPKFAEALNEMIPNVDTDTLEGSINRLSNAFTKFTQSTGIQDKYKALIEGVTKLVEVAGTNIKNIIVGIVAAIVFVVTNALTKVYQGYATTGKQIVANATTTHNQLRAATAARVQAEIALERAKSAAFFASEKQRLQTATAVRNAERTLSARVAAETKAHEAAKAAAAQAAAIRSRGAWATSFATISGSIKKLGASLKSMWSAFAPALIMSAIIGLIGYFKNLYDEAKRIKNIFSEYKKEVASVGNTSEVKMLQAQLSIMNDKKRSQQDINAAQSQLNKMLGVEGKNQSELNSLVAKRIELLKEAAKAEYYSSKIPETEDKMRKLAQDNGMSLSQATGLARQYDFQKHPDKDRRSVIQAVEKQSGRTLGLFESMSVANAISEIAQDLKVWDDANTQLKKSVSVSNGLKGTTQTDSSSPDKSAIAAAEKARKAAQKAVDDQLKFNNDKAKAGLDARNQELENQQSLLNLQEDGFDKERAQNQLNYEKSILAADKYAQDLLETRQKAERDAWDIKNPSGSKTPFKATFKGATSLSDKDQNEIIKQYEIANKGKVKADRDLYKTQIEEYQSYADKYFGIQKNFEKKKAGLEKSRTPENNNEVNRALKELDYQQAESMKSINEEFAQREESFISWSNQIANLSLNQLKKLLDQAKKELKEAESKGLSGNKLAVARAKVTTAENKIKETETTTTPEKRSIEEWQNLYKALTDVNNEFKEIGDNVGGLAGDIIKTASQIATSTISLINSIVSLTTSSTTAIVATSTAAATAIKTAERASVILAAIAAAMQIVSAIITMFKGKSQAEKDTEQLQDVTKKIEQTNDSINRLLEKRIDLINKATAAEAGYLNALTQEAIKQQQGYVQGMFDRLSGNEIFGKKGKNNNLTLTALMDKEGLTSIEDFIKWWNEDGGVQKLTMEGYDLKNEDQWQSIVDSWENLEDAMKSAVDAANEAMTGITFDELKDSLDDLVTSADTTFEDIQKSFEDHMSTAVMNFVKRKYLNDALENWYKQFADAYSDDVLSNSEVAELRKMYEDAYNKAQSMYDEAMKAAGVDKSSSSSTQKASSGYSTSMDQETGSKIEGRITAMQMNLISLDATTQSIMKSALTNSGILSNISFSLKAMELDSTKTIIFLEDIAKDTKSLPKMALTLEKIEKNTRYD